MARTDYEGEYITGGSWLYAGSAPSRVEILGRSYDRQYAMAEADEQLEPGETPTPLGPEGLLYSVRYSGNAEDGLFQTIQEAKGWADAQPWGPVTWDD